MTAAGEVDPDVVTRYLASLVADGAGALAVLAHTGRGPFLTPDTRAAVIGRAVALGVPVLVGVGGTPEQGTIPGDGEPDGAAEQARLAAELGGHRGAGVPVAG
ncbi:hypothetical protein ACFSTC_16255 [Nonomuraea ferruginea]